MRPPTWGVDQPILCGLSSPGASCDSWGNGVYRTADCASAFEYDHQVVFFHRGSLVAHLPDGVAVIHGGRNALKRSVDDFRRFRADVVVDVIAFTEKQAAAFVDTFRGITKRAVVLSKSAAVRTQVRPD